MKNIPDQGFLFRTPSEQAVGLLIERFDIVSCLPSRCRRFQPASARGVASYLPTRTLGQTKFKLLDGHQRFSPGVREMCCREARRLHFGQAKSKYAVRDGAEWIARQYRRQLPMLDEHVLDYYHLREQVIQTSQTLYGEGTRKAHLWQEDMIEPCLAAGIAGDAAPAGAVSAASRPWGQA